ncbi:MAG: NUDIX hydrolase [Elusimicrobiota bacterium]
MRPWKILKERTVFSAKPWFRVSSQCVRLPDGRRLDDYHQIRFPDYVAIVPRAEDGRFILLKKYCHGFRIVGLLFPGGAALAGEPPRRAAARELLEETGYASRRWTRLGSYFQHSNYGCGKVHMFLAEGCRKVQEPDSGDLEEIELRFMSRSAARRHVAGADNLSLACVAAFLLAEQRLR